MAKEEAGVSENAQRLSQTIKYHGFNFSAEDIQRNLARGQENVTMKTEFKASEYEIKAELAFRKDKNGYYHWNSYDATMKHFTDEEKNRTQTFKISNGKGVTFKEAANLLDGREIKKDFINSKDNTIYTAHLSINFNEKDDKGVYKYYRFGQGWKFNDEAVLKKYRIAEVANADDLKDTFKSLNKGNLTKVHILPEDGKPGQRIPVFITSDANNRNFKFFDENGNRLEREKFLVQAPKSQNITHENGREKAIEKVNGKSNDNHKTEEKETSQSEGQQNGGGRGKGSKKEKKETVSSETGEIPKQIRSRSK